jgi:hypothetical protein
MKYSMNNLLKIIEIFEELSNTASFKYLNKNEFKVFKKLLFLKTCANKKKCNEFVCKLDMFL